MSQGKLKERLKKIRTGRSFDLVVPSQSGEKETDSCTFWLWGEPYMEGDPEGTASRLRWNEGHRHCIAGLTLGVLTGWDPVQFKRSISHQVKNIRWGGGTKIHPTGEHEKKSKAATA